MNARSLLVDTVANNITPTNEQKFFANVRAFYEAAVQKMLQKFSFSDRILKDLVILDHRKRKDLDYSHAVCLAERFHLDIDQEELKEEWTDFQLMTDEQLPSLQQDKLSTESLRGIFSKSSLATEFHFNSKNTSYIFNDCRWTFISAFSYASRSPLFLSAFKLEKDATILLRTLRNHNFNFSINACMEL